jgi:integrase
VRSALPDYLQPLLTVGYITGWRIKSELLAIEWRHVDFKARTLRLDPGMTKNDEGREFPFTAELEAALTAQRELTDATDRKRGAIVRHVFHRSGERVRSWRRPWLQALLKAGLAVREAKADGTPNPHGKIIPGVIPHDFRRTAIRNLARAGVSEAIAMRLCGHETRSVFDRYNIVTGDDLRAGVAKLEAGPTGATVAELAGRS